MKTGSELIAEERQRQLSLYLPIDDQNYNNDELVRAAISYSIPSVITSKPNKGLGVFISLKREFFWPWNVKGFNPSPDNRVKELVKAGALIASEIDRIQNSK